jgi:cation transport ATPase
LVFNFLVFWELNKQKLHAVSFWGGVFLRVLTKRKCMKSLDEKRPKKKKKKKKKRKKAKKKRKKAKKKRKRRKKEEKSERKKKKKRRRKNKRKQRKKGGFVCCVCVFTFHFQGVFKRVFFGSIKEKRKTGGVWFGLVFFFFFICISQKKKNWLFF